MVTFHASLYPVQFLSRYLHGAQILSLTDPSIYLSIYLRIQLVGGSKTNIQKKKIVCAIPPTLSTSLQSLRTHNNKEGLDSNMLFKELRRRRAIFCNVIYLQFVVGRNCEF